MPGNFSGASEGGMWSSGAGRFRLVQTMDGPSFSAQPLGPGGEHCAADSKTPSC